MRARRSLLLAAGLIGAAAASPATMAAAEPTAEPTAAPSLRVRVVQSGLQYPWDVAFTPDGRMLVTERAGRLRIFASGARGASLLATKFDKKVYAVGESGMMGLAVDRNFASNRRLYICATRNYDGRVRNMVTAYTLSSSNDLQFANFVIRDGMRHAARHDGCALEHGPDGKVWVGMGDAAQSALAQDPSSRNGKILRVNPDGTVPSDNPVIGGTRTIVYALGLRNTQGIDFQAGTNRPFEAEHGPDIDDEINWVRPGANYGWPCYTGSDDIYRGGEYQAANCGSLEASEAAGSAWESNAPTIAISGAVFMDHPRWASWTGSLFTAQLKEADVRRFTVSSDGLTVTHVSTLYNGTWGRLRAASEGLYGRLYLSTSNGSNDKIIEIVPV